MKEIGPSNLFFDKVFEMRKKWILERKQAPSSDDDQRECGGSEEKNDNQDEPAFRQKWGEERAPGNVAALKN